MGRGRVAASIKDGDWTSVRQAINRLSAIVLGSEATPTYVGMTLTGTTGIPITADRLLSVNTDQAVTTTDLVAWVAAGSSKLTVTDDNDGTITLDIVPGNIDHGALAGLDDGDHNAVYYTETEIDTMLADGTIDHVNLSSIGSNSHAAIDLHLADSSQAHSDYLINNGDDITSGKLTATGGFETPASIVLNGAGDFGIDLSGINVTTRWNPLIKFTSNALATSPVQVSGIIQNEAANHTRVNVVNDSSNRNAWQASVHNDTVPRFAVKCDGKIFWGVGNASLDTFLYRSDVNKLKTDGIFVASNLVVANSGTIGSISDINLLTLSTDLLTVAGTAKASILFATPTISPSSPLITLGWDSTNGWCSNNDSGGNEYILKLLTNGVNWYNFIDDNAGTKLMKFNEDFSVTGTTKLGDGGTTDFSKFEADGTLEFNGAATVFEDIPISLSSAKVPASNAPTWSAFIGNLKQYTYGLNDFQEFSTEIEHSYKEGSDIEFHIHGATNGLEGVDKTIKYEIEYELINPNTVNGLGGVYTGTTIMNGEMTIPASTTNKTSFVIDIGIDNTGNFLQGASVVGRVRRIASTGTEPASDPFVIQVGIHIEKDTVGSRTELTK